MKINDNRLKMDNVDNLLMIKLNTGIDFRNATTLYNVKQQAIVIIN